MQMLSSRNVLCAHVHVKNCFLTRGSKACSAQSHEGNCRSERPNEKEKDLQHSRVRQHKDESMTRLQEKQLEEHSMQVQVLQKQLDAASSHNEILKNVQIPSSQFDRDCAWREFDISMGTEEEEDKFDSVQKKKCQCHDFAVTCTRTNIAQQTTTKWTTSGILWRSSHNC